MKVCSVRLLAAYYLQAANGGASAAASATAPEAAEEVDYASWPIKELRRFLTERGSDAAGIVDKADLVAKVGRQLWEYDPRPGLTKKSPNLPLSVLLIRRLCLQGLLYIEAGRCSAGAAVLTACRHRRGAC